MSSCEEVDIEALVFGDLTLEAANLARSHLQLCDRCRDEHASLARERRLFAQRAHPFSARSEARDPLPDVEEIFARTALSESRFPSSLTKSALTALANFGGGSRLTQRIALAAAAGLVLLSLGRRHPTDLSTTEATEARAHVRSAQSGPVQSAPSTTSRVASVECADDEAVCRESRGIALGIDRAMSYAVTTESIPDCNTEQVSSMSSRIVDHPRPESDSMCVAGAI